MSGNLFIVSAPSGAGKTSLVEALVAQDKRVQRSVSFTTRAPRPGELDGRDYHYVDSDRFQAMRVADQFLEQAEVFGNRYGTSATLTKQILTEGTDLILVIDWQGARQVRERMPQSVGVFVLPPSVDELRKRLEGRGQDSAEVIQGRMDQALDEASHADEYDYVIINDDFEQALADLRTIVRSERLRGQRDDLIAEFGRAR